jgi:hypothetical protein
MLLILNAIKSRMLKERKKMATAKIVKGSRSAGPSYSSDIGRSICRLLERTFHLPARTDWIGGDDAAFVGSGSEHTEEPSERSWNDPH